MNRNSPRTLRTVLTGWLRALIRRIPPGSGAERTSQEDQQKARAVAPQPDAAGALPHEAGADARADGPPEHWLALTRSKGPPQHWLELIRARLGEDPSKVPWIRVRVPSAQPQPQVTHAVQSHPLREEQPTPPITGPSEKHPSSEAAGEDRSQPNELPQPAVAPSQPVPPAERRQPTALRLYPVRTADQTAETIQVEPAPPAEGQPSTEPVLRPESPPQPAPETNLQRAPGADAPSARTPEPDKPRAVPLMPATPAGTQTPAVPAPKTAPEVDPVQPEPEPAPQAVPAPQADHWPTWPELPSMTPIPAPEPSAAAWESPWKEPPAPRRTQRANPLTPQQAAPIVRQPRPAPNPWPDLPQPASTRRRDQFDLPVGPMPTGRWPVLERPEDDDLTADLWESYQREWQRLERLHSEQQGQLWTEWPF